MFICPNKYVYINLAILQCRFIFYITSFCAGMCGNQISTIVIPSPLQKTNETTTTMATTTNRTKIKSGKLQIKNTYLSAPEKFKIEDCRMLQKMQTQRLKQLCLVRCEITYQTLQSLLKADLSQLVSLCLNDNKIGVIGCRAIADCSSLTKLKTLQVSGNKIKDAGAKALATGEFYQLEDLNLGYNGLTVQGVKCLKSCSTIEYLSLAGNQLTDQTAEDIKEINPKGILYLSLSRNKFTETSLRKFAQIQQLEILLMDKNAIKTPKAELGLKNTNQVLFLMC